MFDTFCKNVSLKASFLSFLKYRDEMITVESQKHTQDHRSSGKHEIYYQLLNVIHINNYVYTLYIHIQNARLFLKIDEHIKY